MVVIVAGVAAFMNGQNSGQDYYYDGDGYEEGYVDNNFNDDGIVPEKGDEADYYSASSLSVGDYFELGEYPQEEVTDTRLIAYLDDQTVNMQSYNVDDITYNYGDFEYEGVKYRRVNFTRDSDYRGSSDKYEIDTNYYFIWKPILWDIIGEVDGQWQIITDMVLDGKPMDSDSNYWVNTQCREWLSTTFINDAFDEYAKSIIEITDTSEDDYSSEDQVYLLSYAEATDGHFGFSEDEDRSRQAKATDYGAFFAKWSHYDYLNGLDDCPYYLRTIRSYSDEYGARYYSVGENDSGFIDDKYGDINSDNGIRPTCRINKNAQLPI